MASAVAALALPGLAHAGTGPSYFSNFASAPPVIDGSLAPGEWDSAIPYATTFGTLPATIRFEQDANNLYVAVSVVDTNTVSTPSLGVYFDNNDDGVKALGDDEWNDFVGPVGAADFFWDPTAPPPPTGGGPSHYNDLGAGGSNDTTGAATISSGVVTYEFRHPLCSSDSAHDICIGPGGTAGVNFQYDEQLISGVFYDAPGASPTNAADWGNIHLGLDTTPPSGSITQPAPGTVLRGTVPVTATATDDTGVQKVVFYWYDGQTGLYYPIGTATSPPYTVSFDTTTVPDTTPVGSNPFNATLYADVTDVAGNTTTMTGLGMAVNNASSLGTLHGSLDNDYVFLIGFSPNTPVDLTVKTPTAGVPVSFSAVTDAAGKASIAPGGRWDLVPGTLLTASIPGLGSKTLTLVDIQISSVDTFKNAVFGRAPPLAPIRVFLFDAGGEVASATANATRSGTWSAQFSHVTSPGMLVMADTDYGDTDGDRSRADFTIPAAATGASVSIDGDTSAPAGAASAPIASIPLDALGGSSAGGPAGSPLAGIPLAGIPLAGIPLAGIPLAGIPLAGIGFTSTDLQQNGLGGVPLSTVPLKPPDSWEARLAASPSFTNAPPQSVTLAEVVGTPVTAGVTLADVDVSASPLAGIPLAGIALGGMPLAGIPLAGIGATAAATLQAWCDYVNTQPGYSCAGGSTLSGQTVMGLALSGVPLAGIPLAGIPLAGIDLTGSPLAGIPLAGIDIADSPLAGIPLAGINMSASPLAGIPLAGIPLAGIGNIVDCGLITCSAPGATTLGQAAAANELKPGATLGDLRYLCVPGSPADSRCRSGDTAILLVDFVKGLPQTVTVADLLAALLQRGTYDWESLPLPQFPIQDYSPDGGVVHYNVAFTVTSATPGSQPAAVTVQLPPGARYVDGSSKLGGVVTPDPVWDTSANDLTWQLAVPANAAQTLTFGAKSGLVLGSRAATAKLASGALSTVSADVPASTAITPTFAGNGTAGTATAIAPATLYFGYTPNGASRSYFKVPLADAAGTQVTVHLSHLQVDDDLVVYGPAPAPLRTPRPSTTPTLVPGVVPDISQQTQPIVPEALSDVPLAPPAGASVVGISDNRGLSNEDVSFIVPEHSAGAYATIQVSSFDGGYSDQPWMLRVEQSPPLPLPPTCAATPVAGGGLTEPSPSTIGGSTLYLFNSKRFGDLYGAAAEQTVWTKLTSLAGRTDDAGGTVIPLDGVSSVATTLNAWYGAACSPTSSNDVVRAIGRYLDTVPSTYKYVVLVGGYDVLPPGLVLDNTTSVNERGYATTFLGGTNNQYLSAYALGYLPTDDPYGDTNYSGTGAYVPEASVGRLVETPGQIGAQIDQYVSRGGAVNPTTALVTGYDFMTDGAQQIAANLQPKVPAPAALINETWTRQQLLAALFPASGAPAIDSLNAHYDHHRALPANENAAGTESNLFTTADIAASSTAGRVVITMGCHSGLGVSDLLYGTSGGQDWAETYAAGGAVDFVGNTGYGLGETAGVAYSEQLQALLAQRLNGALTVGQALTYAKQEYAASVPTTSGYQLKVLDEANTFGLPMYRVGTGTIAPPAAPAPLVPDAVTGLNALQFNLSPTYAQVTAPTGGYFTVGGSAAYEDRRPIEPLVKLDVTEPSLVAHGALITGLTSTEQSGFDAAFSRVVDDTSALAPELVGDARYPTKLQTISTFTSPNGTQQRLLLFGGQFRSGALDALGTGTQRLFTSLTGVVLYASPTVTDFEAPTFGPVVASSSVPSTVAFAVNVGDNSGADAVKRVVALYRDASGTWRSVDLARSGATARWSGTGPLSGTSAEWFIQAVDSAGNVGVTSNKAVVESTVPPASTGGITATVTGARTNGWYTGVATVTLGGATGITASVDGGPFTATTSIAVDGTGVHTVSFQGTDASSGAPASGSVMVPIDETPPTISIQSGIISATTKPQVVCADAGSGIASCVTTPTTLDTSVGQHSVHVVATDRVGNVTQKDGSYTVDLFGGFLQPVDNPPTLNTVKAGSAVPVKFGLGLNMGLSIFQAGYPLTRAIDCQSDAPLDSIETTLTAGSSSVQYDASANQYTYVWKTSTSWPAGSCRQLVVRLTDGTEHVANFKFK